MAESYNAGRHEVRLTPTPMGTHDRQRIMAEPTTWTCPTCGRRVPNRATECHCGMQRVTAEAMASHAQQIETPPREQLRTPAPRFRFATVPREIKALFFVGVVVALGGLAWLFVPRKPERAIPLIGTLDSRPVTPPTAKPTPRPTPTPTPLPPGATILGTPLPAPPVAVHP